MVASNIGKDLKRLLRRAVDPFHHGRRQVGANRDSRYIARTKPLRDLCEELPIVARIAGEEAVPTSSKYRPAAPQTPVPIPERSTGKMLHGYARQQAILSLSGIPPIQLFDIRNLPIGKPLFQPQWDEKQRPMDAR